MASRSRYAEMDMLRIRCQIQLYMQLGSLGGSYFWKGGSLKGGFVRNPRTPPWLRACYHVERRSSVVECRTRNRESPGSNPLCYRFEVWACSFTSRRLSRLSCINEYLAIDSGGNVSV